MKYTYKKRLSFQVYVMVSLLFIINAFIDCKMPDSDIIASLKKVDKIETLELKFNLKRTGFFNYQTDVLLVDDVNKGYLFDDSLLKTQKPLPELAAQLKMSRVILVNRKGKRKILRIPYIIVDGIAIVSYPDNFFNIHIKIDKDNTPKFEIKRQIVNLNELKVEKNDDEVSFIYLVDKRSAIEKNAFYSNWVDLD